MFKNELPNFGIYLYFYNFVNVKINKILFVNLTFPEKVEMVELKTSGEPPNVTKTTHQIKDNEKENGPNEPEQKKETGELMHFKSCVLDNLFKLFFSCEEAALEVLKLVSVSKHF